MTHKHTKRERESEREREGGRESERESSELTAVETNSLLVTPKFSLSSKRPNSHRGRQMCGNNLSIRQKHTTLMADKPHSEVGSTSSSACQKSACPDIVILLSNLTVVQWPIHIWT